MSFLSRAFSGGDEARFYSGGNLTQWGVSPEIPTPFEDALMMEGYVPEGSAMTLGAFYACVTLLADIIASLNVKAYRYKDGVKVLVDPQPRLLIESPYPETTWFDWLWMMMEALAVTGNGYGYITSFDKERPSAIMPVHPNCVYVEYPEANHVKWMDPIYSIEGQRIPNDRIVHIKRYPIAGCAMGMSPVQKAASAIGLGLAAERYGLRYFRDSANPSGILTTEQDLTPEQSKRAMKQWITSHQGRRLPAVLSGGLTWQPVMLTPDESQFLETRSFQRSDIAMWFRIPPHMIGDTEKSTSWGTGIENMTLGFVKFTLMPWLTCIEQAISRLLPRGQFAKFNIDGLLRGDVKTRWEAYRLGREAGVYSVNEIRALEDLPAVADGEGRLQPMNFAPLGYEPPQEPARPAESPNQSEPTDTEPPSDDEDVEDQEI